MGRPRKYSDELRRRAIDEVLERGRKINEIARDLGIGSPETLRNWVKQARKDRGLTPGASMSRLGRSQLSATVRRRRTAVS
jgi:transposase